MKKLLSVLLVAVMAMTLCATAFAENGSSPLDVNTDDVLGETFYGPSGDVQKVIASNLDDMTKADEAAAVAASSAANATAVAVIDVSIQEGQSVTYPLPLTFEMKVAPAEGKQYVVMHQKADGTWEVIPTTVSNSYEYTDENGDKQTATGYFLTCTFNSLSPVMFLLADAPVAPPVDNNTSTTTPAAPVSPKTGSNGVAVAMAAVLMAGVVACTTRKKEL